MKPKTSTSIPEDEINEVLEKGLSKEDQAILKALQQKSK